MILPIYPSPQDSTRPPTLHPYPGLDHALCPDYNGDNAGPWSRSDIENHWQQLMKEFPGAKIMASSYDTFLGELDKVRSTLPVVTAEMGDTWIYGVPSDPLKNAQFRAANRLRESCLAAGHCDNSDSRIQNFTRLLLKVPEVRWMKMKAMINLWRASSCAQDRLPGVLTLWFSSPLLLYAQHTWGGDVKSHLHDTTNWDNSAFHAVQYKEDNFLYITSKYFLLFFWKPRSQSH